MKNKIKIAFATMQGSKHQMDNIECQDAVAFSRKKDVVCIALSDGAGSAKYATLGANYISQKFCKIISKNFDYYFNMSEEQLKRQIILNELRKGLRRLCIRNNDQLRDFHATLLFVAKKQDRILLGHIGDGGIFIFKNNEIKLISSPNNGEFSNQTYFLTSKTDFEKILKIQKLIISEQDSVGFMLVSDGSYYCLYDKNTQKPALAVTKMFEWLQMNDELSVSEAISNNMQNIFIKKTYDDCSLIMMI